MRGRLASVEDGVRTLRQAGTDIPTVNSKAFEGNGGGLLNAGITTVEEAKDWFEDFVFDTSYHFLSNFCKCKGGPSLKANVFGKRERCQCGQWRAREEVGARTI